MLPSRCLWQRGSLGVEVKSKPIAHAVSNPLSNSRVEWPERRRRSMLPTSGRLLSPQRQRLSPARLDLLSGAVRCSLTSATSQMMFRPRGFLDVNFAAGRIEEPNLENCAGLPCSRLIQIGAIILGDRGRGCEGCRNVRRQSNGDHHERRCANYCSDSFKHERSPMGSPQTNLLAAEPRKDPRFRSIARW
jgi:hypothetical protein